MTDFTKIALSMALEDLMRKKPFSEITIQDIADRAGVNRQTFYYHFRNVYDLFSWSIERETGRFLKECEAGDFSLSQCLTFLILRIKKRRKVLINAYCSIDSKTFQHYARMILTPLSDAITKCKVRDSEISTENAEAIGSFVFNILSGYFYNWIEYGDRLDEAMVSKTIIFLERSLDAVVSYARMEKNYTR